MTTLVQVTLLICLTVLAGIAINARSRHALDNIALRALITNNETQVIQAQTLIHRALHELTELRSQVAHDRNIDVRRFDLIEQTVDKHQVILTRYASDLKEALEKVSAETTKVQLMQQPRHRG